MTSVPFCTPPSHQSSPLGLDKHVPGGGQPLSVHPNAQPAGVSLFLTKGLCSWTAKNTRPPHRWTWSTTELVVGFLGGKTCSWVFLFEQQQQGEPASSTLITRQGQCEFGLQHSTRQARLIKVWKVCSAYLQLREVPGDGKAAQPTFLWCLPTVPPYMSGGSGSLPEAQVSSAPRKDELSPPAWGEAQR